MARKLATLAVCGLLLAAAGQAASWQIETIDQTGPGLNSSLQIDKDGNAHLCYVIAGGSFLKYAFWDHKLNRWFTMVVDENRNACSLALDSKQHPHISYNDYGTGSGARLRYAYWDGANWKREVVPLNSDIIASYTSLALDANDNPSISFYEYRGPKGTEIKIRLRNVMWNPQGKYWEVRTVDGQEGSGKINSMVSDAQGHFHLGYAQVGSGEMRYAFWDGKNWNLDMVESREQSHLQYVGYNSAIAVDKQGNPHVTYLNEATLQVKYAVRKNGRWEREVVDGLLGMTIELDRNSIVVDDQGRPYISYYDARMGVLKVAHKEGSKWYVEIVDGNGSGFNSSLQIANGTLWISYADEGAGGIKVARRKLAETDAPSGQTAATPNPPIAHATGKYR